MKPIVVGITGASGVVYATRVVRALLEARFPVALVLSDAARTVFHEEMNLTLKSLTRKDHLRELWPETSDELLTVYSEKDLTAPIASGSYPIQSMVIVPCSMGTLGAIASGAGRNLIHRAADCAIKEGIRLVLVPRETPLSAIHLENMLKLSRLGVRMVPAMPGFYADARSIDDLIDFMSGKILDQLDVPHTLYPRWTGPVRKVRS